MKLTWYVTFEAPMRAKPQKRAQALFTKSFATEAEAKDFAREKLNEGLKVFAGTINPYLPKRLIAPTDVTSWIDGIHQPADPEKGERD